MKPKTRLMVCNIGMGFTAGSKFFVQKSKKNLGQKKPSSEAAIWSSGCQNGIMDGGAGWWGSSVWCGLTYRGGQADEASPMVLDQLAHAARESPTTTSEAVRRMNNNRVVTADEV
jgi:hypothetical protein